MGLQDRDYYRERNKAPHQSPKLTLGKSRSNNRGIIYLLYPLITLAGLWYGADTFLVKINETKVITTSLNQKPFETVSGGVILKKQWQ